MAGLTRCIGRVFVAVIFVMSGIMAIQNMDSMQGYIQLRMKDAGLSPHLAATSEALGISVNAIVQAMFLAAISLQLLGGIALAFGGESCGAVMLLIFLAAVTPVMHGPTHTGDGSADKNQTEMIHMLKNLSIAGGLLVMLANRVETPAAPDTKTKTE